MNGVRNSVSTRGFTLIELLTTLALSLILFLALGSYFSSSSRAYTQQQQQGQVTENAEVSTVLLVTDLRSAGYRGGKTETDAVTTAYPSTTLNATRLTLIGDSFKWPFSGIATLSATSNTATCSTGATCDSVSVARVTGFSSTNTASTFTVERVTYTATNDGTGLFNLNRTSAVFTCASIGAGGTSSCGTPVTSGPHPTVEGVEEFQVFFQGKDGRYYVQLGSATSAGAANTAGTASTVSAADVAAVVVYVRVRSSQAEARRVTTASYPAVTFPSGISAGNLGIPSVSYSGTNARFNRVEKILTIQLLNRQCFTGPCL